MDGKVALITGGAGLLGSQHRAALTAAGAVAVSLDLRLPSDGGPGLVANVTDRASVRAALDATLERFGRVDVLINNAARNPKVEDAGRAGWGRFETYPDDDWAADLAVGLTGAVIPSQVIGGRLAAQGGGVILNICSDLSVISPDQRLYRTPGVPDDEQPIKPASYSVVKSGLVGLTRWLATYWAAAGVRVNALSPGGVENGQDAEFVARLATRIPLGRMARRDEYHGAVVFLCSDASSYLTGHNLVIDGGRSTW